MPQIDLLNPPQRILIIKPSAIGDVVHALPVLGLLRTKWPTAHISWLVTPTCSSLLEGHPLLDEVILFHRNRYGKQWWNPKVTFDLWRFNEGLRGRRFDLVIDLQGLFRSGYLSWRTRSPIRVGFTDAREGATVFYTHKVKADLRKEHAVYRYLKVAAALGCPDGPVEWIFPTTDADRAAAAALLPAGKPPYAVLFPGTNWLTKRWPVEHFAAAAKALRSRFGLEPIVAGGPGDTPLANQIDALNLCGKTNLRQLVALLEAAALVIANDSGPMHIAAALGRPLVTPFGPTSPTLTGPYGRPDTVLRVDIPCSPCFSRRCSHQSCLRLLTPEVVLTHAGRQIRAGDRLTPGNRAP